MGYSDTDIAIVGMAAHLPGASGVDAFWDNLTTGTSSIQKLSKDALLAAGEAPHLIDRPDYAPYAAPLDQFDHFDPEFFGLSPKDAAIMDPQHRQFLETAWEAMEHAAHTPEQFAGAIGVFAGCGMGSYFYNNLCSNSDLVDETGLFLLRHTGNDKDFLSTRLSHIFDLTGPSVNIQTACSTSLVATHQAAQSLLNGECDMALAGGVTIELPHARGYIVREGEILSPDGQCHAFDHRAEGTVFGSGVGVVVLRRLADAMADGDHIWAVIKGSAINNDGAAKAGYLAPSVDGQAAAIAEAQAIAGVTADTVDYVECHGTGTYLGDPIEVAALTQAFRETTDAVDFCRIGSVKTNIGHLDTAAGVASMIKASLALHHRKMPPSLGYEKPNPAIGFEGSPFAVNDTLTDWPARPHPPRAGVNSLGVGGTNAHVVLEAAPARASSDDSDWPFQILTISGRSKAALDQNAANLAAHLRAHNDQPLADVAYTLQKGRRAFDKRRVIVARDHADAAAQLEADDPRRVFNHGVVSDDPSPVFMFPGGGAQYAGMARDLYETEPVFAEWMDRGLEVLQPKLDYDIRAVWLPDTGAEAAADARLKTPSVQLPLIMITEYALAQLWMAWGVTPDALIGHSMGENTAACLAGVMSFEDCIGLVHLRGTLFDSVPEGGMLSVALSAEDLRAHLGDDLDLGAVNAPALSVASGPAAALDALQARLEGLDIDCQRIGINIAAHSRMLDPILDAFGDYLRSITLNAPQIPIYSNRSGEILTDAQASDPQYWVDHLRGSVDFEGGLRSLAQDPQRLYIEVGPGKALASLAGQHSDITANQVIGSLRHAKDDIADDAYFLAMLGRVWACGGSFDWDQIWGDARRNRVVLPTYAFQRARYFIEAQEPQAEAEANWLMRQPDPQDWTYRPIWKPQYSDVAADALETLRDLAPQNWLIFEDDTGLCADISRRLSDAGQNVITVRTGDAFARIDETSYLLAPERGREGYDTLIRKLVDRDALPDRILHGWLVTGDETFRPGSSLFHRTQEQGFWSVLNLMQAMADEGIEAPGHLMVLTSEAMRVRKEALRYPDKATVLGPAMVIPREYPGLTCSVLDVPGLPDRSKSYDDAVLDAVLEDALATPANSVAALRGGRRLVRGYAPQATEADVFDMPKGATVMMTGGFGGIGVTIAKDLIARFDTKIVMVARQALPPRADWKDELSRRAPHDPVSRRIRSMQDLEAAGGTVLAIAADISNLEDMRGAKAEAEAAFGSITGLVHAAGVIDDAPFMAKQVVGVEDVLSPKVHGMQVIDALFPDGSLSWMALFSSSSTVTAPAGQVDYVAANAYLNAYADARGADETWVIAINWGLWSEVGMAADAMSARTEPVAETSRKVRAVLLDHAGFDADANRVFTAHYAPDTHWVADEHRTLAGDAVMPGTGYISMIAEAMKAQGERPVFEVSGLYFLRALHVPEAGVDMQLTLARCDGGYDVEVKSAEAGAGYALNAEARVLRDPVAPPTPIDLKPLRTRMGIPMQALPGHRLSADQEAQMAFGPRWKVLDNVALGDGEGLARLKAAPIAANDGMALHPALLDIATGWAMQLIEGYTYDHLWVPGAYETIRVFNALPAEVYSWVRLVGTATAQDGMAVFDVVLMDARGTVCVEIEGFTIRKVEAGLAMPTPVPAAATSGPRPFSPAEERLRHNLTQGIPPQQGAEAFLRALGTGRSQMIVSSLPLEGLIAQAGQVAVQANVQEFERPQMDGDFVAPDTPMEHTLAAYWRELLGVAQVGVEDSFFDLGGHSLIAVRLFAKIKKEYGVDLPISALFEAPNIRTLARRIEDLGGIEAQPNARVKSMPLIPSKTYTHLVPMHPSETGHKAPFFMVSGMFGNVLNLRHLGQIIGADRPFYGLQARGLLGDMQPHRDFESAARDMIAEMKEVQPRGPYFVGGFSGGGITAYEIAQQLKDGGDEIAALVMLDTPLPQRRSLSRADRAAIQKIELRKKGVAYPVNWAKNRIKWEIEKRRPHSDGIPTDAPQFQDATIEAAFYDALEAYQVAPWDGPLALFRPPQVGTWEVAPGRWVNDERAYVLPDNDWTSSAPNIEVFEVPGDHDSMVLEPNVRALAAKLKRVIDAAERSPRRRSLDLRPLDRAAE